MKKIIPYILCLLIIFQVIPQTYAYNYPSKFWDVASKYDVALKRNDYKSIINLGKEILQIMDSAPVGDEKYLILASKYKDIAVAYLESYDYDNSYIYFKLLYDLTKLHPTLLKEWYDISKRATDQLAPELKMYTTGQEPLWFGAVNERQNGVLFGTNIDGKLHSKGKIPNESLYLLYQEITHDIYAYNIKAFEQASKEQKAVVFALNCPNQGKDIDFIKTMRNRLKALSDLFKEHKNVPVYLRFAAEFDVWKTDTDPYDYINAFKYVSEYFKDKNSNVAMVWNPTQAGSYGVDPHIFYPGDEYVDWIGLSSYAIAENPLDNKSELHSLLFKTDKNSSPVITIKEFVEKYGHKKPIMISESGCGNYIYDNIDYDMTDFALKRLREYYTYLPMVYPQVKLIAYFDNHVSEETNDFRLSENKLIENEYIRLTKGARFIQDRYYNNPQYSYKEITNGIKVENVFEVSSYAHSYGADIKTVTYFIDNSYVAMSDQMPFTVHIDANGRTGYHTLKATAVDSKGKSITRETKIYISPPSRDVTVKISGKKINFDQNPVLYNNRTMVPMRKIFEELNASVSWDGETKTVTGRKGNTEIKVTLGQPTMYVNDKKIILDTPPIMVSDRVLVPIRAIAESFGCKVDWVSSISQVLISK